MQMRFLNSYRLLNVAENASPDDIKIAYEIAIANLPQGWMRRLIAQLEGRTAVQLKAAFEELIDPRQHANYDAYLARACSTRFVTLN